MEVDGGKRTHLGIDVEDTRLAALLRDSLDGLDARAVHVAAELGVLDEAVLLDEVEEAVARG